MDSNRLLVVALFAAWLAGCGKSDSAKSTPPQPPPTVEVVTDSAAINAARKAWEAHRDKSLGAIYDDPATFETYDEEAVDLIRSDPERSRRELAARRDDPARPPEARVRAAVALKVLGVAPEPAALASLAETEDAVLHLLWNLRDLYKPAEGLPPPIGDLVVKSVAAKDVRLSAAAAQAAVRYRVTGAADAILARVRAEPNAPVDLLAAAAVLRPSAEVLDALVARTTDGDDTGDFIVLGAIADLVKATEDAALKRRAADACAQHLKQGATYPHFPGTRGGSVGIDSGDMSAVEVIASAVPPNAAKQLLTDVVRETGRPAVAERALAEIQKLDPELAARVSSEQKVLLPTPNAKAAGRKDPTAGQAADACVRHKVLTRAEADAALAVLKARSKTTQPSGAEPVGESGDGGPAEGAEGLLHAAGRFTAFDVETGVVPNRHDRLILDLTSSSAGKFKPEAALEQYTQGSPDADIGKYMVQFIHGGRLYRINPRDLGDWYDLEAVLLVVNRALADAGLTERFVPLASGGQDAALVFADPAALAAGATDLGLTLGADPDEARKKGTEFERQMIEQLRRQ